MISTIYLWHILSPNSELHRLQGNTFNPCGINRHMYSMAELRHLHWLIVIQ